jgi:hypothetical protein
MAKNEKAKRKAVQPTKEQQKHHDYAIEAVTERGQIVGFAYRRKPLFETMYARGEINKDELQALRFYRERYEASNRSPVKSCLAPKFGRTSGVGITIPLSSAASGEVAFMEAAAGLWAVVLRQVAVEDQSFNRIAMNRYGSEEVPCANGRNRLRPKKKSHARRVRSEFFTALGLFLPAAQSLYSVNLGVDFLAHAQHLPVIPGNARRKDARRGQHSAHAQA